MRQQTAIPRESAPWSVISDAPTPRLNKIDIRKLFQNPALTATPGTSTSSSETSLPAARSTTILSTFSSPTKVRSAFFDTEKIKSSHCLQQQQLSVVALESVAHLEPNSNRWTRRAPDPDSDNPELVDRKVKSLLNKLTMEKFDSISNQIIAWVNKSKEETDGRTLVQVIRLVFESAIKNQVLTETYARLCRKMMECISPDVQDDGNKNSEGKPIAGGQLFRKYLLNRCQESFEQGWAAKEFRGAISAIADSTRGASHNGKTNLYSHAAEKAKRQGLGLIQFIGELYKLQMLTERIMHECIKKLLGNVDNPEEEEIESLYRLLTTVGNLLDNVKARAHMDIYFSRMRELIKSSNVSSKMRFMLLVCSSPVIS